MLFCLYCFVPIYQNQNLSLSLFLSQYFIQYFLKVFWVFEGRAKLRLWSSKMAVGREEVEIVKARTDTREYRRIVLPNSLQVLLIADPDTDKATPPTFLCFKFTIHYFLNLNLNLRVFLSLFLVSVCCFHECPCWLLQRPPRRRRTRPFSWFFFFSLYFLFLLYIASYYSFIYMSIYIITTSKISVLNF